MTETNADDIVWGASEIAKVIGRTDRQTFHLLTSGQLPAKKVGDRWVASRKKLLEALIGEAA
ncbi:DNA-binding protein [Oricola sp.]|uniref:DNA-binding protein n=1 Tax=Oricola sp. TaxID=1979950 RepID=UPI0025FA6781|nr:DNA-binding protein [Oricola sp.]MCI5073961.1 DNA-binding protein [Oricola sp.]